MRPFEYEITKANKKPNKIVNSIMPNLGSDESLPHEHDYESFINAFRSWVYIACTKNAVAVASQPLRLYAALEKGKSVKAYKTRELEKSEYLSLKSSASPNITTLPSVRQSQKIVEILDHPFLDLMHQVNNFMNMFDLFELTTLHEDLTGNSYWYILDNKLGIPKEIWPIMPQDMKIIPDKNKFISGYKHSKNGLFGKSDGIIFPESEIIHFKHVSPKSYYYGYSPVWAVKDAYNTGMNMYTYENALFQNGGTLSGVFQTEADLSEYEFERLKEEIKQMFGGAGNAGKAPLLSNGVSYNPYGLPPKEMSYLKGRASLKEEIVNCFVPETKIIMKDGIKNIEDIIVGDEVLTHNGRFRKVLKTFKRSYCDKVYSVKAKTLDEVIVTPNHPAFVFESICKRIQGVTNASIETNKEYKWKHINELDTREKRNDGRHYKDGNFDNLALPVLKSGNLEQIDLADFCLSPFSLTEDKIIIDNFNSKEIKRFVKLDYDFGRLIGYFLAEGSASGHQTTFAFHKDEKEFHDNVIRSIDTHFGSECSLADRSYQNCIVVRNSNKTIRDFFVQFGKSAPNKKMPAWIFDAKDKDFWKGIIEGLVDGDGCFYAERKSFKYVSTSKHLIWQTRLLLMTIGINSSFHIKENNGGFKGRDSVCQPLYMLAFSREAVKPCAKVFDDHYAYIIQNKEESTFNGFVYNIEVEEDNSYVTTGGIFHNCLGQNLSMYSQEANRANSDNAFAEFARNAVRPRLMKIEQKLNEKLLPRYDSRLFVKFDNPVPEDVQFKLDERIKNVQTGIISINAARDDMHLPPIKGLENPIFPMNYFTLDALLNTSNIVNPPIANATDNAINENKPKDDEKPKPDTLEEKPKK